MTWHIPGEPIYPASPPTMPVDGPPPYAPPPYGPPPQPAPSGKHNGRPRSARWIAVAACIGLAVGAGAGTLVHRSNETVGPQLAAPTTIPSSSAPSTTAPSAPSTTTPSAPSTRGVTPTAPPSTTPSASPAPAVTESSLTIGVVDIETVLAYQQAQAAGTGIVLNANGEILTNNHVIQGATTITVTVVATGRTYNAKVVGTDATDDVAVLQLDHATGLATAVLGDSSTVKVGDSVTGVGNAGGRGTLTSSSGTVVQLGQTITATDIGGANPETLHDLIEISARLQPGQSGGPLYDAAGKVVGVDAAATASRGFGVRGSSGDGYAIPINDALAIAKQIEAGQASDKITIGTPGMLGVNVTGAPAAGNGAVVTGVVDGSAAASIGLAPGDVIVAAGSTPIASPADLTAALRGHKAGDKVPITWTSGGVTHSATATLTEGPAN